MMMDTQVLVAYATKHGATAEIAEKIGQALRQAALHIDVMPVDQVGDLSQYSAVVLGSAAYIGRWRKEAASFLTANERALADRPTWLFSSGPTGEDSEDAFMEGKRLPAALEPVAERIGPRDIAVFGGTLDAKSLNFFERFIVKKVGAPMGDFRDWDAITSWASSIAGALAETGPQARGTG